MRTAEHLVGTSSGVFRVAHVMRKPEGERWSMERVRDLAGSPRQPVPSQMGRRMPAYSRRHSSTAPEDERPVQQRQTADGNPFTRDWKIYREDITDPDGAGPTPGCPGCRAIMSGSLTRAGHSKQCRIRIHEFSNSPKKEEPVWREQSNA